MEIGEIASGTGLVALILIAVVFVGAFFALITWLYLKWKQYQQFDIEIWQEDGLGQLNVKYDKGGIFVDSKTKNKRLFIKKHSIGLDPDNVPYMIGAKGKKKVLLMQVGLKNFRYIKPTITAGQMAFVVGEEDVNWAINSYERQKKVFGQTWLAQYLPFMIIAFVSIIILILFMNLFKVAPDLRDAAVALREAAVAMSQARSGTIVV
jgi:hypothetical protein